MSSITRSIFASGFLAFASVAHAWDPAGHMLVGQVAWAKTTPAVREQVDKLLALLPNQYNGNHPYNFVTANCWMDDMRSAPGHAWGKWHYVDIPWTPDASGFVLPAGPNVITQLEEMKKRLGASEMTDAERAQAIAMLVHFVGDIHQPLHASTRSNDKGGNTFLLAGVPFTDLWPGTHPNLHTLWDKAFRFEQKDGAIFEAWQSPTLEGRPAHPGEGIVAEQAKALLEQFPASTFKPEELAGDTVEWARESYILACQHGYPPGEPPGESAVAIPPPQFVHEAREIAERRIVQAGYRAAGLLNQLLAPAPSH
jgi:hypothetical protein